MKVLITGGAGFLGQRLARRLLALGHLTDRIGGKQAIDEIVLVDMVPAHDFGDPRVSVLAGDIADPGLLHGAIDGGTRSLFHLAAMAAVVAPGDRMPGRRA